MNLERPCVIVYNPLAGHGHLDSWNAMFVSVLLASGYRVIAVTEDSGALASRLASSGDLHSPNLQLFDLLELRRSVWLRVFARVSRVLRRVWREATGRVHTEASDPQAYYLDPAEYARHLRVVARKARWAPAMVLNMYMDLYKTDPVHWRDFERLQPLPWAGIRFIPREIPTEGYYQCASLAGMCFLDERVVTAYARRLPDKRFCFLPDITFTELPDAQGALAQKIAHEAAGRRIVFLGGTIVKSKNLSAWFQLIALADSRQWYFVQIGEVRWDELDPQERQALRAAIDTPPGNLFVHDGYLPDERAFNEIIQGSDILFAVYCDFRISSNMLGKSAAFNKPILVADNHLMGARVIRYGIGKAVPEGDPHAMLQSLDQLADASQFVGGFEAYRRDFGRDALSSQLDNLIGHCSAASLKGRAT